MSARAASPSPALATPTLRVGSPRLQRKCACGAPVSGTAERECAGCAADALQAKLAVGEADDAFEREADRVAAEVTRSPRPEPRAPLAIQRLPAAPDAARGAAPASVDAVLGSGGDALAPAVRRDMEQRFGHDFSQVRIHADAAADRSARDVGALAYTVGTRIAFAAPHYEPTTDRGRRLLAHELAHVVQQTGAAPRAPATRLQRQMPGTWFEPWARPAPMPRVGPLPRVGPIPMPETGPLPPVTIPDTGDWEPELETEDLPDDEQLDDVEDAVDPAPDPAPDPPAEPKAADPKPQPQPKPVPPIQPAPEQDEDEDPDKCGSRKLPRTVVTWSTGSLGQGGTVRASPLTRCPGNTVGSMARTSTYPDQFLCVRKAGLSRTWLPLHLLHGATRRTGPRNLHGPGDKRWNIVIGDPTLNGRMYKAVEDLVINRVYDYNQVLWLESRVAEYHKGAEFFAKKVTMSWGMYDTNTGTEGTSIGGGTFEGRETPPACAPTSPAGAAAVSPGVPGALDSTLKICLTTLKSQKPFPVDYGGLEVSLRARAVGEDCDITEYTVELWKSNKHWIDGKFGSRTVPAGKGAKLRWRNLPAGDYYLVFTVGPHAPKCCLSGDLSIRPFFARAGGGPTA